MATTLTKRITANPTVDAASRALLAQIEALANPFAAAVDEQNLGQLRLPPYALDGRELQWNQDRSAVSFVCTDSEYHSDKAAVSSTTLKLLQRSPAHMRAALTNPGPETDARRFGRAVHCAVLEQSRFGRDYVVWTRRRQSYDWEAFAAKHITKEILTTAEYDRVVDCAESVLATPVVESEGVSYSMRDLVLAGLTEQTIYFLDRATGLTCRARIDLSCHNITLDLKTCDDARDAAFAHQCASLGYDLQSAFYLRARKTFLADQAPESMPFLFLAVESNAPYGSVVHCADKEAFVDEGERKVKAGLELFAQCARSNSWPGYSERKSTLRLPLSKRYPGSTLDI